MFGRIKPNFWDINKVNALYEGILRRKPTEQEAKTLCTELNRSGNLKGALSDMLASHEFGVMMLADIVNEHITRPVNKPVFFLHVPKTAGTSFRLALGKALGIDPFLLYRQNSWRGFGNDAAMQFWPFWAGHAGISAFPDTHRGVTLFREPRSRILSSYRQQERALLRKNPVAPPFHEEECPEYAIRFRVSAARPFAEWIKYWGNYPVMIWFVPVPNDLNYVTRNGLPRLKYFKALSESELRRQLCKTLGRFDAVAWTHDQEGMARAIATVTQTDITPMTLRKNTFSVVSNTKPTILDADDIEHIERVVRQDRILIESAVEMGLIEPIDTEFAQHEFEKTAERLGFKFA